MADTLTITKSGDRIIVFHLSGILNANTEKYFVSTARQLKDTGVRFLLVDMSGVELITSAGLRALHDTLFLFTPHQEIEAWQKENPGDLFKSPYFKLAEASPQVYSILNLAGFLHNVPIYPSVKDALASFNM
jgi:hypothetical protein